MIEGDDGADETGINVPALFFRLKFPPEKQGTEQDFPKQIKFIVIKGRAHVRGGAEQDQR